MLPSPSPFASRGLPPAAMYRRVGLETKVHGASPHMLVALLFDGLLEQLSAATAALHDGRIGDKGQAIGRAVRILDEGLKAALDLDAGGKLAADLEALYGYATLRLTQANLNNDAGAIDECRRLIVPVRDAWAAIGTDAAALRRA
jgi:flagellar protein FliS